MAWNTRFNGLTDEQLSVIFENSFDLKKVHLEPAFYSKESSTLLIEPGEFIISTSLKGRGVKSSFVKNCSENLKFLVQKAKNLIVPVSFDFHDFYRGIGNIRNICSHFAILLIKDGVCTFIDTIVKEKTSIKHYKRWQNVKAKLIPAIKKELNIKIQFFHFHRFRQPN